VLPASYGLRRPALEHSVTCIPRSNVLPASYLVSRPALEHSVTCVTLTSNVKLCILPTKCNRVYRTTVKIQTNYLSKKYYRKEKCLSMVGNERGDKVTWI
jgi:hypothetical protein